MVLKKILHYSVLFEADIVYILNLFKSKFGLMHPLKQWREGYITRFGFLDENLNITYTLHGRGCTAEINDKKHISFDFGENNTYTYSVFKLEMYIDSICTSEKQIVSEQLTNSVRQMIIEGYFIEIENEGIRLNNLAVV